MRSRQDKRRRSRISPIDRLIQTQAGRTIVSVVKSKVAAKSDHAKSDQVLPAALTSDETPNAPEPKRKSLLKRIINRLQYPMGWGPIVILVLTWVLMLGVIWGACKEIMSLGTSPTKQTIAQIEQKTLLELLGALCLGGAGLSLAITPTLKRPPRHNPEPMQTQLDSKK